VQDNCLGTQDSQSAGDALCREGHRGPMCQICRTDGEDRYVWAGKHCEVCDGSQKAKVVIMGLGVCAACLGVVGYIFKRYGAKIVATAQKKRDTALALFVTKMQVKYKIVVTFTQVLSKVATLYPINLPTNFDSFQEKSNPVAFMDIELVPVNCFLDLSFHDKLLVMTLTPIAFILLVLLLYGARRVTLSDPTEIKDTQAKCISVVVVVLYTVFPLVSATIFRTFAYDAGLAGEDADGEGPEYLKADYTIKFGDPSHVWFQRYAMFMGLIYCVGLPLGSFMVLSRNKDDIVECQALATAIVRDSKSRKPSAIVQRLKSDKREMKKDKHMLRALSLLYKDYEPQYWYFECVRCLCTLLLCGLVNCLGYNLADSTLIFVLLLISTAMLIILANHNPYVDNIDDKLAQLCQMSLSLVMAVGLLEQADPETFKDVGASFGWILIICVSINWGTGFVLMLWELAQVIAPKKAQKTASVATMAMAKMKVHNKKAGLRKLLVKVKSGSFRKSKTSFGKSKTSFAKSAFKIRVEPSDLEAEMVKGDEKRSASPSNPRIRRKGSVRRSSRPIF
jgi:hypothetical protein